MPWSNARPRGASYGTDHARARRAAIAAHQPWHLCGWCGLPLGPAGPWLHLAHAPDRRSYVGLWHAACNLEEAAKRARALQDTSPLTW